MQRKVSENYTKMKQADGDLWRIIDADKTPDALTDDLETIVRSTIDECSEKVLNLLWE
jgi:thymidylate kinase